MAKNVIKKARLPKFMQGVTLFYNPKKISTETLQKAIAEAEEELNKAVEAGVQFTD